MMQVIAHRGARSLAPENTLPAARLAWQLGADCWETDVQLTCDGQAVLHHDETFLRCTDVAQVYPQKKNDPVSSFSLSQVENLDAGSFYLREDPFGRISHGEVSSRQAKRYQNLPVPTLEQALELTAKLKWRVNLELKIYGEFRDEKLPKAVLDIVEKSHVQPHQVLVSSFYHPWLDLLRHKNPEIMVQALIGEDDDDPDLDFEDFRFETYNINAKLILASHIKMLKARKKKINLFTVNEPSLFSRFESMRIDGIFTDFPQKFSSRRR